MSLKLQHNQKVLPKVSHRIKKALPFFLLLLITIGGAFTAGGCQRAAEEEKVVLTFIHGWGGTVKTHATMQEIYREFERRNPNIILNFQPSSDSSIAVEKANDMLAVDQMPDIVSTNGKSFYVANAVKRKKALDLMPYIQADSEWKSRIHPAVLEGWTTPGGKLYTVPDALEVMGYWYRADYFKQAGIIDETGEAKPPATWREFYEACEKLKVLAEQEKEGGPKWVYALETVQTIENLFLARLAGSGEEGLQMAQVIPETFDTKAFREATGAFAYIFSYSGNVESLDDARAYFKDGKTAMYFNGVWESEELREGENANNMAYANYPSDSGESISYISPSSGYVLAEGEDEKKKEAAILFLKYMLSDEVQLKMVLETGQAPAGPNLDLSNITEKYPLLGNALEEAYGADIQIKTISSVWSSARMDVLSAGIKSACSTEEGMDLLISNLNKIK